MKKIKSNPWIRPIVFVLSMVVLACGGDDDWTAPNNTTGGSTSGGFWDDNYSWGVPNIYNYPTPEEFDFSELASGMLLFRYYGEGNGAGGEVLVDIKNKTYKQVSFTPSAAKFRISPDSQFIAYYTSGFFYDKFWEGIYVGSAGSQNSIKVSYDNENSFNPSWSFDGSKIFFWSSVDGNPYDYALCSVNKNGTDLSKLTHEKIDLKFSNISESPSGLLTFSTNKTSEKIPNAGIFLLDPKMGSLQRIIPKGQGSFLESPVFSPDGSKIAYLSVTRSDSKYSYMDVMVWNLSSKTKSKIIGLQASGTVKFDYLNNANPTPNLVWSPEGDRILFCVPEGNPLLVPEKPVWNFYVVNNDGANLKKVTKPSRQIEQYDLSWGR